MLKCFPFGFKIGSCVKVGSVQPGMPKPIADHSHIDTRSHQLDTCAVAKGVRRYPLFGECRYLLCSRLNISIEFKSNARRTEGEVSMSNALGNQDLSFARGSVAQVTSAGSTSKSSTSPVRPRS